MTEAQKLVAEYVKSGSEAAFCELASRYINLVFSTALRLVNGDSHRAEDVVQTVFVDLARTARTLPKGVMLGGWLHRHTCFVAANTMRGEHRRQFRERQAVEMNALQENSDFNFSSVAPILDEAINGLGDLDRTAILLRFFEQHDFRAIGKVIGGSEDSARMRVNRALEKLETLLKRQGITSTTAALSVALSANAVQAAPAGMAASVATFALAAGTAPSAATVIAAAKTVTMTTLQKAFVAGVLALGVGTAIYEARQAADRRTEIQILQRQQGPLTLQVQQLQRERNVAANQLAAAMTENERLQSSPNEEELLRLRNEVTLLEAVKTQRAENSTATAAKSWLDRVNRLKEYLKHHPDKTIPEFRFLAIQRWLNAIEDSGPPSMAVTNLDEYYHGPIYFLRSEAERDFGARIQVALQKYAAANQGQFPTDLSQLQPYCDPQVEALLEKLYEIKPASILPAERIKEMNIKTDWVVVRKEPAVPNSTSRGAYFANGSIWWQTPPGHAGQQRMKLLPSSRRP